MEAGSMKKYKFVTTILLLIFAFATITYAATSVGSFTFSIDDSQTQSSVKTWTASVSCPTNTVYITTRANVNAGAEDTYYLVALTAYGPGCQKVLANGTQVRRNMYSYSFSSGSTYGGYAWRFDDSLRTNIVNGYVFINKK